MFQVLLHNVVGLTDNFMVGSLGPEYMAALTISSRYFFFLTILLLAFISSVNIISSQLWGKKDIIQFKRCYATAIGIIMVFSLVIGLSLFLSHDFLIKLMTKDTGVYTYAADYMKILSLLIVASSYNIIISGIFIASGDTKTPFKQQIVTTGINVILNYLLIFGNFGFPKLLVSGAGIASLLSILIGNVILTILVVKKNKFPPFTFIIFPDMHFIRQILKIGLPILGDMLVWQVSSILYIKFISDFGSNATAIWGVAGIYMMIQSILVLGFINGAGIKAGHLIGSKDHQGALLFSNKTLLFTLAVSVFSNIILAAFAFFMPYFFKFDNEAVTICIIVLLIITIKHLFQTVCGHLSAIIRAGKITLPLFIMSITSFLIIGLPLTLLSGPILKKGIIWIAAAITLEEVCKALISYIIFIRKKWLPAARSGV